MKRIPSSSDYLKAMDDAATAVATMTGVKAQFVDAGWSVEGAEQMVIELMRNATASIKQ